MEVTVETKTVLRLQSKYCPIKPSVAHQNLRLRNKNCQIKPSAAAKTCGYNGEISQKPKNLTIGTGQVSQQFSTGKIV